MTRMQGGLDQGYFLVPRTASVVFWLSVVDVNRQSNGTAFDAVGRSLRIAVEIGSAAE